MQTFKDLNVSKHILSAIKELGFEYPTPVQEQTIPLLLATETDLVALAQTGTGKTAAFGIPIIQKINTETKETEALILSPTRELCMQIAKDLENYSKYINNCTIVAVYGGASIENQRKELKRGAKIIVGTPGRMVDLLNRGYINLKKIKTVVLDEADEMLDMGFKDDLDTILSQTPAEKNTHLFSATMQSEVAAIARDYMNDFKEITIGTRNSSSDNVKHFYYTAAARNRYAALKRIVDIYPNIYGIIFCRTRAESQDIAESLIKDGYNAAALHGDLSQAQRDHVMKRFREKHLQLLVATDVAARGIDVNNLTHVINYNLPNDAEQYNHRSGRTGRADKTGTAISIINEKELYKIKQIEKSIKKEIKAASIPSGKEICEKQLFHIVDELEHINVNYDDIEEYLPAIFKKLEWIDKEELIRRFVSIEFNRFLEYYKDAKDINVQAEKKSGRKEPERKARQNQNNPDSMVRLSFSVGRNDRIVPQRIIGMINDYTRNKNINIGRIDIFDKYSLVDVDGAYVEDIVHGLSDLHIRGRRLEINVDEGKSKREKESKSKKYSNDAEAGKNFKPKKDFESKKPYKEGERKFKKESKSRSRY